MDDKKNYFFQKKQQNMLVTFITFGTIAEYVILAFNIIFTFYCLYIEKKVLKTDSKAAEKLIKSKEFFIYDEQIIEKIEKVAFPEIDREKVEDNIPLEVKVSKISKLV
jgi:hypothetical protein